jgi:hypothetical protein
MYIGGAFTSINGVPHAPVIAVNILNGEVIDWNPTIDMIVTHLEIQDEQLITTGFIKLNEQVIANELH